MLLANILLLANLFVAQIDSISSNILLDNYKDSIKIEIREFNKQVQIYLICS